MHPTQHIIARATRRWLLWLALVLLAAHSLAIWHPYTHRTIEAAGWVNGKYHIGLSDCDLCLAGTATVGGAPPPTPLLLPPQATPGPMVMRPPYVQHAPVRRPYTIRAPPIITA